MDSLVTIVIPTFQREENILNRALKSVLYQTYKNIEVLIIDDNKNEYYSKEILKLVQKIGDDRVKVVKNNENIGGALSRNKGISLAKGEYISFLDDDDFYLKDKIDKQVKYLCEKKFDFTISNLAIVNQNLKLQDIRLYRKLKKDKSHNDILIDHYKYHYTGTPTFLFSKEALINCGGFPNVQMGHEFHLVNNLLEKGYKLGYVNEVLTIAVAHQGERVSNRKNREIELDELLKFKLIKSKKLKCKDKRRIYFRHNLASAFNFLNKQEKIKFMISVGKAIFYSPSGFIEECMKRIIIKMNSRGIGNEKK